MPKNNSNNKYVLIASTGKNDIKFLVECVDNNGENIPALAEINSNKDTLRVDEVHALLLNGSIPHQFDSNPYGENERADIQFFKDDSGKITWTASSYRLKNCKIEQEYQLYAAKLNNIVKVLKEMHGGNEIEIVGGLFLGTDRGRKNEPIASHILLAKWFALQFPDLKSAEELPESDINSSNTRIFWCNMTKDIKGTNDNNYEGQGKDYPVKRIVARRIDDSVQYFLNLFSYDVNVLLSDTGGMDDLKAVLSSSVKFRTRKIMLESHETEHNVKFDKKTFAQLLNERNYISRRENLEIRNLVEDRILQGDFLGAWASCAHLLPEKITNEINDEIWIYAVYSVRNYILGINTQVLNTLTIPDYLRNDFEELGNLLARLTDTNGYKQQSKTLLIRLFFTIESALQASRPEERQVKQALITCTALSDQLLRICIFHYLDKYRNKFESKVIDTLDFTNDEVLTNSLSSPSYPKFIQKSLNDFGGRDQWRNLLKDNNITIAITYQNRLSWGGEDKTSPEQWKLQQWRNAIAHGRNVNEDDIKLIINKATEYTACTLENKPITVNPLWNPKLRNNSTLPLGECFLNQYYVTEIENQLGYVEGSTQKNYQQLIETLLKIVRSSIYTA